MTKLATATLARAKWAYTTRRVHPERATRLLTDVRRAGNGDLLLAEVREVGQHKALQLADGRLSTLFPGDRVVVAVGARYAPDQFCSRAEISGPLCHLAAAGGIAGTVETRHERMGAPTLLAPLGLLADADGSPLNLKDAALALPSIAPTVPVLAVVGTSMNSGKTTTAANVIFGLAETGLIVGAAKITGTGAFGDPHLFRDAGAAEVLDFTDAGHATTVGLPAAELERIAVGLCALLADRGCGAIVLEIADGILQRETRALLAAPRFRALLLGRLLFAAADAVSAVGGVEDLRNMGLRPLGVSGVFTASPLAIAEAAERLDVPVFTGEALRDPARAKALLAVAAPPVETARRRPAPAPLGLSVPSGQEATAE